MKSIYNCVFICDFIDYCLSLHQNVNSLGTVTTLVSFTGTQSFLRKLNLAETGEKKSKRKKTCESSVLQYQSFS